MATTWYRSVTDCSVSVGSCAFTVNAEPLFNDGTDHGIGSVSGACGWIRIIGKQSNGAPVDDTYYGCTGRPAPAWAKSSLPVFAFVLKHRVSGTWRWTASMSYQGVTSAASAVCPGAGCGTVR